MRIMTNINLVNEKRQIKRVKNECNYFKDIINPTPRVKYYSVKYNAENIRYITNPSEELKKIAIQRDCSVIKYMKNPSYEIQLEAIKQHSWAIEFIKNPHEEIQLEVVKQNCKFIECIDNPCNKIKEMFDIYDCKYRNLYVLKLDNGEYRFTIGCQDNMTKEEFLDRIYNNNGGLENNPYRQEYLDILERY